MCQHKTSFNFFLSDMTAAVAQPAMAKQLGRGGRTFSGKWNTPPNERPTAGSGYIILQNAVFAPTFRE
jgi:hypothetical protein